MVGTLHHEVAPSIAVFAEQVVIAPVPFVELVGLASVTFVDDWCGCREILAPLFCNVDFAKLRLLGGCCVVFGNPLAT
jgi:hypothetical protein